MWARVDLGIPDAESRFLASLPWESIEPYHRWSTLGPRIGLVIGIGGLLIVLVAIILARAVLARPRGWPIAFLVLVTFGVGTFPYQIENLVWYGAKYRLSGHLHPFQAAAKPLMRRWPTKPGDLPEAGPYLASGRYPGRLWLRRSDKYSFAETFGTFVHRLNDGGISFSLAPNYRLSLEWHPRGHRPGSWLDSKGRPETLVRTSMLEEQWFLTQYR